MNQISTRMPRFLTEHMCFMPSVILQSSVSQSVGRSVSQSVSQSASQPVSRSVSVSLIHSLVHLLVNSFRRTLEEVTCVTLPSCSTNRLVKKCTMSSYQTYLYFYRK